MAVRNNVLETVRADDFVEYYIFPLINTVNEREQEELLSKLLNDIQKSIQKFTKQYLWHKDEFKLETRTTLTNTLSHDLDSGTENLPPHLYGVSHFGDNIEDEWFMVFLLRYITKEFNGLIARVHDNDGEFLLIEAADYLPEWASPETCEKRVYLVGGNLHLVPVDDLEEPETVTMTEALLKIRNDPELTLANAECQNSINTKLERYPNKISENFHKTSAYLPVGVAAILRHKPSLIAPAVQAFCNRDPIDLKACKAMKYFPPENRVNFGVNFTKCLYAMLTHSRYVPDRRTGWNLPLNSSPQYKAHNLGMKIACGFEILISQAKPNGDLELDRGWQCYLGSLKEKNYFRGLLENSRDYNDLLNRAKDYYLNHRDSMNSATSIGQQILDLTKTLDYKIDELKAAEESLPPDDDDSWLNINPDELEKMLQEKYGKRYTSFNNNSDASSFTEKVTKFLNHESGLEGAEFPDRDDEPPIRPPRSSKRRNKVSFSQDTKMEDRSANNRISFDPNAFSCAVQNILNFVIPEDDSWDLESGSDMSDYADDNYVSEESLQNVKTKMQEYMEEMDKELASTTIGDSFEKKNGDGFEDIENFQPVDIDMNALKNILESYRSQLGEAGPSSNMLGPMGIHLDRDK